MNRRETIFHHRVTEAQRKRVKVILRVSVVKDYMEKKRG